MSKNTIRKKCEMCGSILQTANQSFTILDCISPYIREKLKDFSVDEKCNLKNNFCHICNSNLTQDKSKLVKKKESLEQKKFSSNIKREKVSLEAEIELINSQINNILSKLKANPSHSVKKVIKRHQKWFYKEFSGEHLRKKVKHLDYLTVEKGETRSLLGEATKFSVISRNKDKRFLIKYSKDSGNRNNHGAKEIITEKIMTDIADYFMNSAKCSLIFYKNRLAIASKIFTYFGDKSKYIHRAIHGREIFEYSFETPPQKRKIQKTFYELDKIEESIIEYPKNHKGLEQCTGKHLLSQFRLMLLVDAFLGNQDRHHENWCFVLKTSKQGSFKKLYFSPLFDTGRGLFWNENIYELIYKYRKTEEFNKYLFNSSPLFHLKDEENTNHFSVVKYVKYKDRRLFKAFKMKLEQFPVDEFFRSYIGLISPIRIVRMKKLLKCRRLEIIRL